MPRRQAQSQAGKVACVVALPASSPAQNPHPSAPGCVNTEAQISVVHQLLAAEGDAFAAPREPRPVQSPRPDARDCSNRGSGCAHANATGSRSCQTSASNVDGNSISIGILSRYRVKRKAACWESCQHLVLYLLAGPQLSSAPWCMTASRRQNKFRRSRSVDTHVQAVHVSHLCSGLTCTRCWLS